MGDGGGNLEGAGGYGGVGSKVVDVDSSHGNGEWLVGPASPMGEVLDLDVPYPGRCGVYQDHLHVVLVILLPSGGGTPVCEVVAQVCDCPIGGGDLEVQIVPELSRGEGRARVVRPRQDYLQRFDSNVVYVCVNLIFFVGRLNNKKCILLVINKEKSFDKNLKGDFNLDNGLIARKTGGELKYIYTGLQIINPEVFLNINENIFSISKVWDKLIQNNQLHAFESNINFLHASTLEIYKKLNIK